MHIMLVWNYQWTTQIELQSSTPCIMVFWNIRAVFQSSNRPLLMTSKVPWCRKRSGNLNSCHFHNFQSLWKWNFFTSCFKKWLYFRKLVPATLTIQSLLKITIKNVEFFNKMIPNRMQECLEAIWKILFSHLSALKILLLLCLTTINCLLLLQSVY